MAVHIFFPEKGGWYLVGLQAENIQYLRYKLLDYKNKIPLEQQTI